MGQEVLKSATRLAHFSNFNEQTGECKTHITIVSDNDYEINKFQIRYSHLDEIPDIEYTFINMSVFSKECTNKLEELIDSENAVTTIVICSDQSEENYMLAGHLPLNVYRKKIPVIAQLDHYSPCTVDSFHNTKTNVNVRFFGYKNVFIKLDSRLRTAQMFKYVSDILYSQSKFYEQLPIISGTNDLALNNWFKYQLDNIRQTILTSVDCLSLTLETLGWQLNLSEKKQPDITNFPLNLLGWEYHKISRRQMLAWSILAGYSPTEQINDQSNWTLKQVDILFTLTALKEQKEIKHKRCEMVRRSQQYNEIILLNWLYQNLYYLTKIEN